MSFNANNFNVTVATTENNRQDERLQSGSSKQIVEGGSSSTFNRDLNTFSSGEEFSQNQPLQLQAQQLARQQPSVLDSEEAFQRLAVNEICPNLELDDEEEEIDEAPLSLREILDEILGQEPILHSAKLNKETEMTNNDPASQEQQQQQQQQFNQIATGNDVYVKDETSQPYVVITEQPAKCSIRFRYECEGRSAGSIPGINSTADNKTYPTIKICNYIGRAVVVVSCVSKEPPYKAHPHNIVGRENCRNEGICTVVIDNCEGETIRSFPSIGIQCVKKKEIGRSLRVRESVRVDPFNNGFKHKDNPNSVDLSVVRLCFQVFIEGSTAKQCDVALQPVVSEPIHDKKAMSDLVIVKLSHCSAPATGGREIILLCDRINKDDITIRFFEERGDELIWETFTELTSTNFHKQVAISFRTPKYRDENIVHPVMCKIQLIRMSDNQSSEPRSFQFLPCESDEDIITRKRHKVEFAQMNYDDLIHRQQQQQQQQQMQIQGHQQPRPYLHPLRPSTSQHYRQQQQQLNYQQPQQQLWTPDQSPSPLPMSTPSPYNQNQLTTGSSRNTSISPTNNNNRQLSPSNLNRLSPQETINRCPPPPSVASSNDGGIRVRARWLDNSGNEMQLVDGPQEQQESNNQRQQEANNFLQNFNRTLASSLDKINTAELVGNVEFNTDVDLNLGSGLLAHLNAVTNQDQVNFHHLLPPTHHQQQQQHPELNHQQLQAGSSNFTLNNPQNEPQQNLNKRYTPDNQPNRNC